MLCSWSMPPQRAWGEFDGPTANCVPVTHRLSCFTDSTHKCLQSVMASGLALAWGRPMGHGGVSWVDAQYFRVCQGSCQAVLSNTQPRKSNEGWRSRTCTSNTKIWDSVSKTGATTHLIILCDCIQTYCFPKLPRLDLHPCGSPGGGK